MKSLRRCFPLILLLVLAACSGENLFPTSPADRDTPLTGAIVAQVIAAGVPLGGVDVVIVNGPTLTTNADGIARFENLAPGVYTVSVRLPQGFLLDAGEEANRTVTLAAGGTQSVTFRLRRDDIVGAAAGA